MILVQNLSRVTELSRSAERVLDVGGCYLPLNVATHVIDIQPYGKRGTPLDPESRQRFTEATWTVADVCAAPWPYPDKYFDFCFCSHLLEDVRDPLAVVHEINRVAKAGYVETPSRAREILAKARFARCRMLLGRAPEVGFYHHRWFVELEDNCLVFTAKTIEVVQRPSYYITRGELGRKMTAEEAGLGLFWTGELRARENIVLDREATDCDLSAFKARALGLLRQ